jgi:site-specific DNA-methyltransferase (adenine-specific)
MDILPQLDLVDAVITDPPYGDTACEWDIPVSGWWNLIKTRQFWAFGSMKYWLAVSQRIESSGWKHAQEVIWEKHNGSSIHKDRFRRVHEIAVHWYKGSWGDLYHETPVTHDAKRRTVKRTGGLRHFGKVATDQYTSEEGGPRKMRSVIEVPSCHGYAIHPTQKPIGILDPLVQYSLPSGSICCDPFMGSGSTGIACLNRGVRFIGIEKDPVIFKKACERYKAAQAQGRLFK